MRKKKNPPKESRERERVLTVFVWENMDRMREIISNLYKIKQGEEESKYRKEKRMREVQRKSKRQWGDKEANMEEKGWKKFNNRCGLIGSG